MQLGSCWTHGVRSASGTLVRGLDAGTGVGCRCHAKTHLSVMLPDSNVCFRSRAQSLPESQRNASPLMLRRRSFSEGRQRRRATKLVKLVPRSAEITTLSLQNS